MIVVLSTSSLENLHDIWCANSLRLLVEFTIQHNLSRLSEFVDLVIVQLIDTLGLDCAEEVEVGGLSETNPMEREMNVKIKLYLTLYLSGDWPWP